MTGASAATKNLRNICVTDDTMFETPTMIGCSNIMRDIQISCGRCAAVNPGAEKCVIHGMKINNTKLTKNKNANSTVKTWFKNFFARI